MSNQTNSEYQKAIDYLYQMASDGQLIVGSKIPSERELAQKTGISRNSTREAISILRGIGIVESRHGSGNYVSKDPGSSISMMIKAMLALKSTSKAEIIQVRKVQKVKQIKGFATFEAVLCASLINAFDSYGSLFVFTILISVTVPS